MHVALAVFLLLHGFAHLPGFLVPWRFMTAEDMPYRTTILAGRVDLGDAGIRAVGVAWLVLAALFAVSALATGLRTSWWQPAVLGTVVLSLVLSFLGWPDARIGVVVNVAVLAFLVANRHAGWIP